MKLLYCILVVLSTAYCAKICSNRADNRYYNPMENKINCEDGIKGSKVNIRIQTINEKWITSSLIKFTVKKLTCSYNCFFNCDTDKKSEYITNINHNIVREANRTLIYDAKNMTRETNKRFKIGTNSYICNTGFARHNYDEVYYITLERGVISYKISTGDMISANSYMGDCKYEDEYCVYDNSVLVWNINKDKDQHFVDYINAPATLIIDKSGNKHYILENELSSYVVREDAKLINGFYETTTPSFRLTETVHNNVEDDSNLQLVEQLDQAQYAIDYVKIVDERLKYICKRVNDNFDILFKLCVVEPTACAIELLKNKNIDADIQNDILIIKDCMEVQIIKYKPRIIKDDLCYVFIPVTYIMEDATEGFLNPYTNKIHDASRTTRDCDAVYIVEHEGVSKSYNKFGILKNLSVSVVPFDQSLGSFNELHAEEPSIKDLILMNDIDSVLEFYDRPTVEQSSKVEINYFNYACYVMLMIYVCATLFYIAYIIYLYIIKKKAYSKVSNIVV